MVYKYLQEAHLALEQLSQALIRPEASCSLCARSVKEARRVFDGPSIPAIESSEIESSNMENSETDTHSDNDRTYPAYSANYTNYTSYAYYASCKVCRICSATLPRNYHSCYRCAIPLMPDSLVSIASPSCGACLAQSPIQYRSVCAFNYLFPLPELCAQLKYQGQLHVSKTLAELFANHCRQAYQDDCLPELIIPVPLHPLREFNRGFNQAELLAKHISRQLNIPYASRYAKRIKNTKAQNKLSISERQANLSNAFAIDKELPYQHIALFDDIMTTGTTFRELAKIIQKSGVARIDFWSLCRTPKL